MPEPKRGLGRGLSALIPAGGTAVGEMAAAMIQAPIDDIAPNPRQPRQGMDQKALEELASSIKEHGVIQPLIVTRSDVAEGGPTYRIVTGERRWRASRLAGLTTVPVIVKDATPLAMLELALVENVQRADLSPLEMAAAFRSLIDEFGLTQEKVAERVGKSRVAIANTVRLLRLPDDIKEALAAGQISEGHARAILGLDDAEMQLRALNLIIKRDLNVRQVEETVRLLRLSDHTEVKEALLAGQITEGHARAILGLDEQQMRLRVIGLVMKRSLSVLQTEQLIQRLDNSAETARRAADARPPETRALEDRFRGALGTKVDLVRTRRGGRLVIHFYSEEELQSIYDLIVGQES